MLGLTARLHPQLRGCIDALGLEEGRLVRVPDALLIRESADDPVPLWGQLMRDNRLRLRMALIGWAQGIDLSTLTEETIDWEVFLPAELVRTHVVHGGKERDDKKGLARELDALQWRAANAHPAKTDPKSGLTGHRADLADDWSDLDVKYSSIPEVPLADLLDLPSNPWWQRLSAARSDEPRTDIASELLRQGWHLVAPTQVVGWMIAQQALGDTRRAARNLGVKHLGLKDGFRAADRARYLAKLSRQHRDLATLTLQRDIMWALADLGAIPESATDAGGLVQTMLLGRQQQKDCCVVISGDHLRVWYRVGSRWSAEPSILGRLPEDFSMLTIGADAVTLKGARTSGLPFPITVTQLQLHTFPRAPGRFPVKAWTRRAGISPASVIPQSSFDEPEQLGG